LLIYCFVGIYVLFDNKLILVSIDTESIAREIIYAYIAFINKPEQAGYIADLNCPLSSLKTQNQKTESFLNQL
jgi:GTP:adenosylcobinamide-phosphate guanylyltransferase